MARTTVALGVELVGNEARLALVEKGEQGLSLLWSGSASVEELPRALRGLPKRPQSVVCALSLEHAAVRTLSLPPTTEENLDRLIGLEAEAALPLAADDLALSHHSLGMSEQSRLEVLVGSARQSTVQSTLRRVNCAPWVSATVTVSSIALYNALQKLRGPGPEQVAGVLRIEETEAELMLVERGRIISTLYIPLSGAGVGARAEQEVRTPVAVGAGGAAEAAPTGLVAPVLPWVAALSQQLRYALQSLSYERGTVIERLYLCGKGARTDAAWQLSERLEVPITLLTPKAQAEGEGVEYAVAFGCAAQAAGDAAIALNLTPARVSAAREGEQRRQAQISWGALGGAVAVAAALVYAAAVHNLQSELATVKRKLGELRGVASAPAVAPAGLDKKVKGVNAALETRMPPGRLLSNLNQHLPQGTWLSEMTYNSQTGCVIRGFSADVRDKGQLVRAGSEGAQMAQAALLKQGAFDDVTLDYRNQEKVGNEMVWGFQLTCKLQPPERPRRGVVRGGRR